MTNAPDGGDPLLLALLEVVRRECRDEKAVELRTIATALSTARATAAVAEQWGLVWSGAGPRLEGLCRSGDQYLGLHGRVDPLVLGFLPGRDR
jgi:hypothetical protein